MAKIVSQTIKIKLSKIEKGHDDQEGGDHILIDNEVLEQIEAIVAELVGDPSIIIELD